MSGALKQQNSLFTNSPSFIALKLILTYLDISKHKPTLHSGIPTRFFEPQSVREREVYIVRIETRMLVKSMEICNNGENYFWESDQ